MSLGLIDPSEKDALFPFSLSLSLSLSLFQAVWILRSSFPLFGMGLGLDISIKQLNVGVRGNIFFRPSYGGSSQKYSQSGK